MAMEEGVRTCPIGHELELKNFRKQYICDGCKEQGYGPRYRCECCDYDLHDVCMFTTETSSHDFFETCTFRFFERVPKKLGARYCDACGKDINGFVYHCKEKGWDLHPCCRNLKHQLHIEDIEFRLHQKVSSRCTWCNKKNIQNLKGCPMYIRGWSYVSKCKKYHFHVYCAMESVLENLKGCDYDEDGHLTVKKMEDLPIQLNPGRNKRRASSKYWKIVKVILKTIAGILLSDPTITLGCMLSEAVWN